MATLDNQQIQDPSTKGIEGIEGLEGINRLREKGINIDTSIFNLANDYRGTMHEINQSATPRQNIGFVGINDSMFDDEITSASQLDNLSNTRGELQPWYAQIGAGLAKGVVLAGTTFLDGTLGLLFGGAQAIKEGRFSALWDNPFSKAMQSVNEWSEKALPNYYTDAERNEPWYENIFTANFLGDKFIKNLGFSVGAFYGGNLGASILKGGMSLAQGTKIGASIINKSSNLAKTIGIVKDASQFPAMVTSGVGSVISAVNEGRIEALNNSTDWFNLQKAKLDNTFGVTNDDTSHLSDIELSVYADTLNKISEDRLKMGNSDLLMNIPILTASNLIQFGRIYANGFKTARKATNIVSKAGEYATGRTTGKGIAKALLSPLSEGTEEISQKAAATISGLAYEQDVNNFYKAKINPEAEQQTIDWIKAFAQGINETVNDGSSWEEFFIGSLTGALGMPRFRGIRSSEGKVQSPITLEEGVVGKFKEYKKQMKRDAEIADYMNARVQSPEFKNYYQGLIRHNKYQNDMNQAVKDNNEFDFKNAEHAQLISDIAMFDNAGKLEDLKTLIASAYNTSDKNIASIIENTTSVLDNGDLVGPFAKFAIKNEDGTISANLSNEKSKEEVIKKITKNKDDIFNTIKQYQTIKDNIDIRTGQQLSDEQLEELTWLKSQIGNWQDRANQLSSEVKSTIGTLIGNMSELADRYNFIKNEEGKEHAELSDIYKKTDKNEKILRKNISTLQFIKSLSDKVFAYTLSKDSKLVQGIKSAIEDSNNGIDADDVQITNNKIDDIVKLANATEKYNTKLKEYFENPTKLQEDIVSSTESIAKEETKKKSDNLKSKLSAATNLSEFRQVLNEEENLAIRAEAFKSLEDEGNEMAKNYREVNLYNNDIQKAINSLDESPEIKSDALKLFQNQFENSSNLKEIANPNSTYINNKDILYDDKLTLEENTKKFQEAQYALLKAINQVNNDNKFKDRFSKEYRELKTNINSNLSNNKKDTTDDNDNTNDDNNIYKSSFGNVTSTEINEENKQLNNEVETPQSFDDKYKDKRPYYRPAIPELHIEASKEGDFRPFNKVVVEREKGVNFDVLYNYLEREGAFTYVNEGNLKVGDEIGFMIDPVLEEQMKVYSWYKGPTILLIDKKNNHVVGSLDEKQSSVNKYEGLASLREKIKSEYVNINKIQKPSYFDSMVSQLENKKSSWEYYRDDINRTYNGIEYVTGTTYQSTIEPAINFAIDSGVLSKKYKGYLNKTRDNSIEKKDLQEIIDELHKLGITTPSELIEYINKNSNTFNKFIATPTTNDSINKNEPSTIEERIIIDSSLNTGMEQVFGYNPNTSKNKNDRADKFWKEHNDEPRSIKNPTTGNTRENFYKEFPNGTSVITFFSSKKRKVYGRQDGMGISIWRKLTPNEVKQIQDYLWEGNLGRIDELAYFVDNVMHKDESKNTSRNKFIATPTTKVSKIMVGKIPYGTEERSLAKIFEETKENKTPIFGIIKNGILDTNKDADNKINYDDIIKPVDMSNKEGRMYLLIPNAAGKYSPAAVRIKHFNRTEFNPENVEIQNTQVYKNIQESINLLANSMSEHDLNKAVESLSTNLYTGNLHIDWFTSGKGNGIRFKKVYRDAEGNEIYEEKNGNRERKEDERVVFLTEKWDQNTLYSITGNDEIITEPTLKDIDDVSKEIMNILLDFNLPIQVDLGKLNRGGYNNILINSNVLTSNISEAKVIDNWFTTDYIDSEGNLHKAINPISITPKSTKKVETPVGGKEGVIKGTKVVLDKVTYNVDLTTNKIYDNNNKRIYPKNAELITDIAWANANFGNATEGSLIWNNKIQVPSGKILDRETNKYLRGKAAQKAKDEITNKKKTIEANKEKNIENSKRVLSQIAENQKKVDKTKTDSEFYYILEEDGQYHKYERVHSRLGNNWVESKKQTEALKDIKLKLSQLADDVTKYNDYLKNLSNYWKVDLSIFNDKIDAKSRDTIVNIIRDSMSGTNSQRALNAGTAVDSVIRNFFTSNDTPVKPDNMSEKAFTDLITSLTEIRSNIEARGERFLTNNIVLFQKYADGTRIAGEVDILSVDADGNFRIYDVKTSRYSFHDFTDKYGNKVNYFLNPSATQKISTKDYYTLQLSAYKNLFESQYHTPITTLAIMPFVLNYNKDVVDGVINEKGIMITYNPAVNVPLINNVKVDESIPTNSSLPIFNSTFEIQNPINNVLPEYSLEDSKVGYFVRDGKLHKSYLAPISKINGIDMHMAKIPNITKGHGNSEAHVASNTYIAVFPNGNSIALINNDPLTLTEQQAKDTIKKVLNSNPQKVVDMSNEETLIFNPASNNKTDTSKGASLSVKKTQAVMEHDDEFEDEDDLSLYRKVDELNTIWDKEKELEWIKKVLPKLVEEDRVKMVEGLIKAGEHGELAWGQFDGSIVTLSDIAAEGTTYHEAFHVVFNLLLDQNERTSLLNEYRKKHPNMDDLSLEEELAEDFREFVIQGGKDTRSLGRKIIDFFKSLFIKTKYWKDFRPSSIYYFKAINDSKYSKENIPFTTSNNNKYKQEEYTQEMKDILAKAPRDSQGKLLAPNGRLSNLTERQYAQVRTKAFKNWFGDWELIAYDKAELNSIPNLRKINVDSFLKAVDSRLEKDYLTTGYLNKESVEVIKKLFDLSKIQLYQGDIKEYGLSFYTGAIVLSTMKMEEAAQVFVHEILHSYTTYAYDTDATFRKEINKYHKIALSHNSGFSKDVYEFMANTLESGHMATLLEIPSENNSSNLLKDIINSLVKHIRAFFKIYETRGKRTLFHDIIETIYNHKKNNSEFINNVSKVVDENGEPLVVYHGSKNGNFDIFDDNYLRKTDSGFFFTSDKEYAKQFGNTREFFLNIKNPNLTNIPLNIDTVETLLTVDYIRGTDGIQGHDDTNTNENLYKSKGQEYVAIRPNQIKSATDNIGTFDSSNPDIRYRKIPSIKELRAQEKSMYDKYNNDIEEEYRKAVEIVNRLNYKRFNTPEEAMNAFNESGIRKDFFYRITRAGANNAVGYKIQLITRAMLEQYKIDNNPYSENYEDYITPVENFYFDSLDPEIQMMLFDKGWTKEEFDSISQEERDVAVECIYF